ncbi:hypothetical protein R6Q57_006416 [Mikania cordata]
MAAALECWSSRTSTDEDKVEQVYRWGVHRGYEKRIDGVDGGGVAAGGGDGPGGGEGNRVAQIFYSSVAGSGVPRLSDNTVAVALEFHD